MTAQLNLRLCVLLIGVFVSCIAHSKQNHGVKTKKGEIETTTPAELTPPHEVRHKRQSNECREIETDNGIGLQRIINVGPLDTFRFFIQPERGFKRLVLRGKLKSTLTGTDKYSKRNIIFKNSEMQMIRDHENWIQVDVEYFKDRIHFAPDPQGIRVKIGNVKKEISLRWWRLHSYDGFAVDIDGGAKILLNCDHKESVLPQARLSSVQFGFNRTVVIACVLGACFLILVTVGTLYLLMFVRRHRTKTSDPPRVPKTLARGRCDESERCNENKYESLYFEENIYESIDESTIAKLKQNFDVNAANQTTERSERNTRTGASEVPEGGNLGAFQISLQEEKEEIRRDTGLDSPVENHYVEMHKIVSRNSSLSK